MPVPEFKSAVVGTEGEALKPRTVVQGGSGKWSKFLGFQVALAGKDLMVLSPVQGEDVAFSFSAPPPSVRVGPRGW